jgi:predicted regulator of Ras-like GTPase activity (Roadblock/LC7/MglB family)
VTRQGTLRQTIVYSSGGYMAVYAIDPMALIVVLGDEGLNIARLHLQARPAIERIASILAS